MVRQKMIVFEMNYLSLKMNPLVVFFVMIELLERSLMTKVLNRVNSLRWFFLFLLFPLFLNAQTGPGGIGNSDGSDGHPELLLWLNSDSLAYSDNDNVEFWTDISGNGHDLQQTLTVKQPEYFLNAINGRPAVAFDGTDDFLVDEDGDSYINGLNAFTLFTVIESNVTNTDAGFFDTEDPDSNDDVLTVRYDKDGFSGGGTNVVKVGLRTTLGDIQIESSSGVQSITPQLLSLSWKSGSSMQLFVDGKSDALSADGGVKNGLLSGAQKVLLGKGPKDGSSAWNGNIAEVILFASNLSAASRVIVENYINARYGIVIANDLYSSGDPAYVHNLSGIGNEIGGSQNSGYSSGLRILSDSDFDTGEYVLFAHNNADNTATSINVGSDVTASGAEAAWNREWYVEKTGNVSTRFSFNIPTAFEKGYNPPRPDDYVLLYKTTPLNGFSIVATAAEVSGPEVLFNVQDSNLQNGYFTLGTLNQSESPVQGKQSKIWYTLISGNWEDWETWTLDSSGALPDNPDHLTPENSENDEVVILNGRTVDVNTNNLKNGSVEVNGRLNIAGTTGHSFGEIAGNGRILLQGDNFPTGDASKFASEGKGTVEFYGAGATLANSRTFNDVILSMDNRASALVLNTDYTLVGDLIIKKGTLQINDNSNTTPRNLDISNNVIVQTDGNITVGTADGYDLTSQSGYGNYHKGFHVFRVGGSFENNGTVRMTNQLVPDYASRATTGAVSLVFYGSSNNVLNCNNTTDLYNLVVDKGSNRSFELEVYADNKAYFALFGENDGEWDNSDAAHPENRKALWIANGSLRLTGSVFIPSLTEGTRDYTIGRRAGLVLDGPGVFVQNSADENSDFSGLSHGTPSGINTGSGEQALYPYGKLHVINGYWYLGKGEAINFRDEAPGIIQVDGGVLEANQIAVSSSSSSGNFAFILNGGEVRVTSEHGSDATRALLNLDNPDMVFSMKGGALYIDNINGHTPNAIHIASADGNFNVSGGTVYINSSNNAQVLSTAPFYNLQVVNNSTLTLLEPLEVLNDLLIDSGSELNAGGFDVAIGRNFDLKDNASYISGSNTTRFTGNSLSNIYVRNTTNAHELTFNNLELDKEQSSDPSLFNRLEISSNGRAASNPPLLINGNVNIKRGELDVDQWNVDLHGNIEIVDGQIIASNASAGKMVLNGSTLQTIKGSLGKEQSFGHLELNNVNGAKLLSNINVADFILTSGVVDLDTYNLDVSEAIMGSGFGSSKMFKTAGNASDGGLSLFIDFSLGAAGAETVFPVGTDTDYCPTVVTQSAIINEAGTISVNPVNDYHPSATVASNAIPYYWVVDTTGFLGLVHNDLKYTFTYGPGAIPGSVTNGLNLWPDDYAWYDAGNVKNGNKLEFPYSAFLTGDYTIGNKYEFNQPTVFYSITPSSSYYLPNVPVWSNGNNWSTESHTGAAAGDFPQDGDIAVIGYGGADPGDGGGNQHHMAYRATDNYKLSGVIINSSDDPGVEDTRLFIENGATFDMGVVDGNGILDIRVNPSNPGNISGDFGRFVNNYAQGSRVLFLLVSGTDVQLPSMFNSYPNVRIEGGGIRTVFFPDEATIMGDLQVDHQATLRLEHDLTVNGDLGLGDYLNGIIEFPDDFARELTLHGNLSLHNAYGNSVIVDNSIARNLEHRFRVGGDIELTQGDKFDLFSDNSGGNNVILELFGDADAKMTNVDGMPVGFYRLVMNKMEGRSFDFQDFFTLYGPTNGDEKSLELISGRLQLSDPGIDITLSSGGADFRIPAEAELNTEQQSIVRVTGNNTGIWLDGRINVGLGTNWFINGGINNYIEYTSSGNSVIDVFQGNFYVGSQIRRSTATEEGTLHFSQKHNNSDIIIGTNANDGGETSRGVFEMLNESTFSQVEGSELTIANALPNAAVPSFYLDLDESNVDLGANSAVHIGGVNTVAGQSIGFYSSAVLRNVVVDNQSANNPVLDLELAPLTLENLTISGGTSFRANGLDVNLSGNLTNNGTYIPDGNTTLFSGITSQLITGDTGFYNFIKSGIGNLALDVAGAELNINNRFEFYSGTLTDNSNTVFLKGNAVFDGLHLFGGSGNGIVFDGTSEQVLAGNGKFGKLTINNPSGVVVPVGNDFSVSHVLRMERGILNIDKNLLILDESCVIEEVSEIAPFSASKMIQTNISFTDNGVKKIFPSGASDFVFPMGAKGKYTPVSLNISANSVSGGSLIVKPSNEPHSSVPDPANVLQYHWVLRAQGVSGFEASARMKYVESDVAVEYPNAIQDYLIARLLSDNSGQWNKFSGEGVIDEASSELVFTFSGTNDDGISGDYTAGMDTAIPDQVPGYTTKISGAWSDEIIWDTYPVPGGTVPGGGPSGAMVYIQHEVNLPINYISSYRTTINGSGKLKVGSTFGHRMGDVFGDGILTLESGNLPAGVYDGFLQSGTFEFAGNGNYDVLGSFSKVNNLIFSGTGERRLPNIPLQISGNILLSGADLINEHNCIISLKGSFEFASGSFDAGTSADAKWIFNGKATQQISGPGVFDGDNGFNYLEVNNPIGILLETVVEVQKALTLTDGVVNNTAGNRFAVTNASADAVVGGGPSSYVSGPFEKTISNGGSFSFPVGNGGRYGALLVSHVQSGSALPWIATYHNQNPGNSGLDTERFVPPLEFVSKKEYWNVKGPDGADADVTIRWDSQSGVSADPSERNDLRVVTWSDLEPDAWSVAGSDREDQGTSFGTIKTDSPVRFNEFVAGNNFTIGGTTVYTYSWEGATADWFDASNWVGSTVPSMSTEVDIPENPSGGQQPVINGDAFCKDLLIYPNAMITLEAGATLTVDNSLVNNGEIFLKSNPDNVSALNVPVGNTDSGNGRIELPVKANQWYRLGQPFVSPSGATYDAQEITSWVYRSTTQWQRIINNSTLINPMEGIMVFYESDHTISNSGKLNTGPLSWTIPYGKGYYLFSNPYPSAIKWDIDDVEDTGVTISDNLSKTIYYRVYAGSQVGDYMITYNGVTGHSTIESGGSFLRVILLRILEPSRPSNQCG